MVVHYTHEPGIDFTDAKQNELFQTELENVAQQLGTRVPLVIQGEHIYTDETFQSLNPADTSQTVAHVSKANLTHIEKAFSAATEAFQT